MPLSDVVNITITRATATPTQVSFNDLIIVAEFLAAVQSDRVAIYNSLTELTDAGFGTTDVVYLAAAAVWSQNPAPKQIYVGRKLTGVDGSETWTECLTALKAFNNDWYGMIVGTRTLADQELVAAWVESNGKLCIMASNDANILDSGSTDDLAYNLSNSSYARSACIYHSTADLSSSDEWADAAWMGKMFPKDPGSATWAYKTLAGVAVDTLTTTQIAAVLAKNGNVYIQTAGNNNTYKDGTVGEGEYIDIIRGTDWLAARMAERIYTRIINEDKVSYTDGGIAGIEGDMRAQLDDAVSVGLLNEDYITSVPKAADVSAADKGNRTLNNATFIGTYQQAIHAVNVTGTIGL